MKMSTRNNPGGKGGRCVRLTTSPPLRAECHEIWGPKSPGKLWATPALLRDPSTPLLHSYAWHMQQVPWNLIESQPARNSSEFYVSWSFVTVFVS
jgi:hypothetical protein